jgi:hypothetical protein
VNDVSKLVLSEVSDSDLGLLHAPYVRLTHIS